MQPFRTHTGLVVPLDRVNVDTDQMIPKQFCKLLTREGYGKLLFYDWRYLEGGAPNPDFVLNRPRYRGASVLLARANFGCGSSREHAPWGVLDFGFRVLIAPSYADIFYNNCFKNGILPITLPPEQVDELFRKAESQEGYQLSADLVTQTVSEVCASRTGLRDEVCASRTGLRDEVCASRTGLRDEVCASRTGLRDDSNGLLFHFAMDPYRKEILLKGLDDIAMTLQHEPQISAFELSHPGTPQIFQPVDLYNPPK